MAKQWQPCRAGSATILRANAAALCCRSGDPASIARVFGRSVQDVKLIAAGFAGFCLLILMIGCCLTQTTKINNKLKHN